MDVFVKKFVHYPRQPLWVVFVGDKEAEREVTLLPSGSLAQQRVVCLAHVGLEADSCNGRLEPVSSSDGCRG